MRYECRVVRQVDEQYLVRDDESFIITLVIRWMQPQITRYITGFVSILHD